MAGDWQTTSEKLVYENESVKKEEAEDVKSGGLNVGVRKRRFEAQEEEEEAGETVVRKGWGSTIRTYPGPGSDEDDLSTLLKATKGVTRDGENLQTHGSERSSRPELADGHVTTKGSQPTLNDLPLKKEEVADTDEIPTTTSSEMAVVEPLLESFKHEEDSLDTGVVFKKRKTKPIRQK